MASTSISRIASLLNASKIAEEVKKENLEWCFWPMLICLRIFGIDFKWNQRRSFLTQNLIRLICLFWSIITVATIYGLGMDLHENFLNAENSNYRRVSQKTKFFCLIVEIGGIYAALVFSTWTNGQKLVESFNQIEIYSEIDKKTYHQLRYTIVIATFLSILTVSY